MTVTADSPTVRAGTDLAACTVVAKPLLAMARVLARSFGARHPGVPFFVLLADEIEGRFEPAAEPFELVAYAELDLPDATALRFRYPRQALSYAVTPFLLHHLLGRGFRRVAFIKQESLVVGDLSPTFARLERAPILLTPHLLAPLEGTDAVDRELSVLLAGAYNAGFVGVSAQPEALRFLAWWSDRVSTHAHQDVAAGFHFEQRWLDLVPAYFEGAEILRDPGDNVGHWNLPERRIEIRGDGVFADDRPCRLARFSGYDPERPERATVHSDRLATATLGDAGRLFDRYRRLLIESGHRQCLRWSYAWERFDDGEPIPALARELYRRLGEDARRFGDPFATGSPSSFRAWLDQPEPETVPRGPGLSRYWQGIWSWRDDLQRAFPDPTGADRERFLAWASTSGRREHPGSDAFLRGGTR